MANLFTSGYDPTQLAADAAAAKTNAAAANTYLQSATTGLPKVLADVAAVKTALTAMGINVDDIETLSNAINNLVTQIKGYTDTEVASILSLVQQVASYTDSVESTLNSVWSEGSYGLVGARDEANYGRVALRNRIEEIHTAHWANGNYGLVGARDEASYGRVALRSRMGELFHNYTWGHLSYGLVGARDEATWGRVAIRNRLEDTYGQAAAANSNAWHAIEARSWIHQITHGNNFIWSLPQIRAILDDIRNIAIEARDNAAAANSNAATAANKIIPTYAVAYNTQWNADGAWVQSYSLKTTPN